MIAIDKGVGGLFTDFFNAPVTQLLVYNLLQCGGDIDRRSDLLFQLSLDIRLIVADKFVIDSDNAFGNRLAQHTFELVVIIYLLFGELI